ILVHPHDNTAKGFEVYFDRPLGEHFTARASYAYSVADEHVTQVDNVNSADTLLWDPNHSNPQDQRHAANVDITYRVQSYTLNTSFAYHSGWPSTLEQMIPITDAGGQPNYKIIPEKLWDSRLSDYMRLDMRATRDWPTE